jgi:hypothetical protein
MSRTRTGRSELTRVPRTRSVTSTRGALLGSRERDKTLPRFGDEQLLPMRARVGKNDADRSGVQYCATEEHERHVDDRAVGARRRDRGRGYEIVRLRLGPIGQSAAPPNS